LRTAPSISPRALSQVITQQKIIFPWYPSITYQKTKKKKKKKEDVSENTYRIVVSISFQMPWNKMWMKCYQSEHFIWNALKWNVNETLMKASISFEIPWNEKCKWNACQSEHFVWNNGNAIVILPCISKREYHYK
jgi:predicted RNA-binding protein